MSRRGIVTALAVAFGLSISGPALPAAQAAENIAQARPAAGAPLPEAGDFIMSLADKAIAGLTDLNVPLSERTTRFRMLLNEGFDVQQIGRFVLGRFWRSANEDERAEYLKLFEDFIVHSYATRFREYAGENLRVVGTRAAPDSEAYVITDLVRPSGPPVRVEWRLRRDGSGFKIVDVLVESVSMSITQRDDFSATIQRAGGRVEGLLAVLRDKVRTASN
jgi:phospholipid transport system substrate-binding protein